MTEQRPADPDEPSEALVADITDRLGILVDRVSGCGRRLDGKDVTLIGVTKFHPLSTVLAALRAGISDIGESVARECVDKIESIDVSDTNTGTQPRWHFIGQLQTNKVRALAGKIALYQSVDRSSLVREIAKRDPGASVLIQVRLADEVGRGGVSLANARPLIDEAHGAGLAVEGVMGIGPQAGADEVSRAFDALARLGDSEKLRHCSMGMSGDLEIALEHGSTMIRVGSDLFGARP